MEVIESMRDLRPGDLMFGPIHGGVGLGVGAAQLLLATAEPGNVLKLGPKKWWRKRHCGVIVASSSSVYAESVTSKYGGGPMLVQAEPRGIEMVEISELTHWNEEYVYIRPVYEPGNSFEVGYKNRSQGFKVAYHAKQYVGRPYDFATYGAIPLYRSHLGRSERIKRIISDTTTMMCSRLVDAALCEAGFHLFDDGRLPGDVTPSELYRRVLELPIAARSNIMHRV